MTTKQILIVDNHELNRAILKEAIEKHNPNYKVVVAPDGRVALNQLRQQPFDLILTDFSITGPDSLKLVHTIHQTWPNTPIVLMTDCLANLPARGLRELGFNGYIKKPVSSWRLYDLVDHFLHKRKYVAAI